MIDLRAFAATLIVIALAGCSQGASSIPFNLQPPAGATPTVAPAATTPTPSPIPTSTPTPAPTATPIPTPAPIATAGLGPVVASPTSINFIALGAAAAQTVGASQSGYAGAFAQSSTCAAIATVIPASAPANAPQFTVTPVAAGSCTLTISGGQSQSVDVSIAVTTSGLVISSRRTRT